jgi:septum formation protein
MAQIILASASPRRRELLDQIGLSYQVRPVDIDETPRHKEDPLSYVQRLAAEKSLLAQQQCGVALPILAADTSVVIAGNILGKPLDKLHALSMLQQLSGQTHQVYTAISLRWTDQHAEAVSITDVSFRELSEAEINYYWTTGEPCDKAGAYAIQGLGSIFVSAIHGSFSGVVGLPLFETASLLAQAGINIIHD